MASKELPDMPMGPALKLNDIIKKFHIPQGLKNLLQDACRDVLRTQPENLYSFLADFMEDRFLRRDFDILLGTGKDRRKSWEWRRWSSDGSSLLTHDELLEFLGEFHITFEAAVRLATIIQSAYRGFLARQEAKARKEGRLRRRESLWEEWRHEGKLFLSRRDVEEILAYYGITLLEANAFATKIQAVFRGHYLRKSLKKKDPELAERLNSLEIGHDFSQRAKSSVGQSTEGAVSLPDQVALENDHDQSEFQRLPKNATPSHYALTLQPNLTDFKFEGSLEIKVEIVTESSVITLNSVELELKEIGWESESGENLRPNSVTTDVEQGTLTLCFEPFLPPGRGTLKVSFTGVLNDQMKGFYRFGYKSPDGQERIGAVTQFEANFARVCFPCWDEPQFKATFDVTLVAPKDRVALSNMPIRSTTEYPGHDGLLVHVYETTPIMSTYLLAFVIGEFDNVEAPTAEGVICRVFTPIGKKEQGRFALDIAVRALTYYKNYFGIAYPLPKLDIVGVPDFSFGAMENWGLVTFRDSSLLVPEQSSVHARENVATILSHEIAHMWFGNLVTMEWWTHLWLNEGYATFVGHMGVNHLFPEYDIWTQFQADESIPALEVDALRNGHPIEVAIKKQSEIMSNFDIITYSKGASLIRMLHHHIGNDNFQKGMKLYLTSHQYKNTCTEDLWNALSETSSVPVGEIMSTWTKQAGFPLIKVEDMKQVGKDIVLRLTQRKFWSDPFLKDGRAKDETCWMVPLTFTSGKDPTKSVYQTLMRKKSLSITIPDAGAAPWLKVNSETVGFYRVQYPPKVMAKFVDAVQSKYMVRLDRLGLLDDLYALYQSGKASVVDLFSFLPAFISEDDFTVFTRLNSIFAKLDGFMKGSELHNEFKAFGRSIFANIADKLGWDAQPDEGHMQTNLRTLVLTRMSIFDDVKTRKEALRRFELHLSDPQKLDMDLRKVVYRGVASGGGEEIFDSMMKMYREQDDQDEKDLIANALGYFQNPEILKKVVDFAISDEVRSRDSLSILVLVGGKLAWECLKNNWKHFTGRDGAGVEVRRILEYVGANLVTEEAALEVETFFRDQHLAGSERHVQQAIESIRLNDALIKRDLALIETYLRSLNLKLVV